MRIKNVLLLYKKSAYKIYFLEQRSLFNDQNRVMAQRELDRFRKAHKEHYATLKCVESVLKKYEIDYTKSYRGQIVDFDSYDLVITVGGENVFVRFLLPDYFSPFGRNKTKKFF